jgi:hypothetical protein
MNTVMNLWVSKNPGNFLNSCTTDSLSARVQLDGGSFSCNKWATFYVHEAMCSRYAFFLQHFSMLGIPG